LVWGYPLLPVTRPGRLCGSLSPGAEPGYPDGCEEWARSG
jgi:hypothetical protein